MATQNTQQVTCPKCSGKGIIEAFSGTANGKCFTCWGAGTISVNKPSAQKALRRKVSSLRFTAEIAMRAADDSNDSRRDFYLGQMLNDGMFEIGTANARLIIAHIRKGECLDHDGWAMMQIDRAAAHACAARLIELGRERKAAA